MNAQGRWERVRDAFWPVPALCLLTAGVLALGLVRLDRAIDRENGGVAFTGGPDSARSILSTIAASMLSLTALVFSITIVVLSLTSNQFSPRVLRQFVRDRLNQFALGLFLSTFAFALVALREVRGQDGRSESFVPGITITVAFVLVAASVVTFVQYLNRITQSIQVVNIIARISREAEQTIDAVHPADGDAEVERPTLGPCTGVIHADRPGVVASVNVVSLVKQAAEADVALCLLPSIGAFVPGGGPLVEVHGDGEVDEASLCQGVSLQRERNAHQDVAFGFRQLVDIAERALSPGINDPTTAVQCLDQVHHLLRTLASRPLADGIHRDEQGTARLIIPVRSWPDYLSLGLDEVRHWGASSLQVQRRIREILHDLATVVETGPHRRAVDEQLRLLDERLEEELSSVEEERARPGRDPRPA